MYEFQRLTREVRLLARRYECCRLSEVGKSLCGRPLYLLRVGSGEIPVLYAGAFHGLEGITAALLVHFCRRLCQAQESGLTVYGIPVRPLLARCTLYCVPMVNPDGVEIALDGPRKAGPFRDQTEPLYRANGGKWQANARGVDINHNFDAGWNILREMETVSGITGPAATRYGGPYPHSEPETRGIINLIYAFQPRRLYSFHSQGEEIFWEYGGLQVPQAESIARALSALSGYTLVKNSGLASHGGLKDWFIQEFRRPGFTIEIGKGENPLPIEDLEPIYGRLLPLLTAAAFL